MANKGTRVEMDETKLHDAVEGKPTVYPSILKLDEGDLPSIKTWKVGKEYKILITAKMIASASDGSLAPMDDSDKEKIHGKFEVVKAEDVKEEYK